QRRPRSAPKSPGGGYRTSPSERAILDFSAEQGIPRSIFLGRQRRSVTRYHYDEQGRLDWAETVHDAEWLAEDADAALERQAERALICQGCGHFIDESHDDKYKAAWIVDKHICWGCAARE